MPNVNLGPHLDRFVQEQIDTGRFQNASEVIRAGLRLLEDQETDLPERRAELRQRINEAFDDPRPPIPAEEVFDALRARIAEDRKADERGA